MKDNLDNLDRVLAEKAFYIGVLRLWTVARDAGYNHDEIATFTFCDNFLGKKRKQANHKALMKGGKPPYSGITHHNAVRLKKDNSLVEIPLIARPTIPDHMKVDTVEKLI